MAPPETGFVRASRSRSSDGGCLRPPALSLDDLGEDAGPSGILPASPIPADYALPLADDHAGDLLASVLAGQPTLTAACSRLFDKRGSHAAIAFLHYCISHWPQTDNATLGPLLQQLTGTGSPAHLLSCVLLYISSNERRTAAEAAKAWHALGQRVAAEKLLEAVLAEPNCLQWMLEAVDLPSGPMRLSICGTPIPLKHRRSTTDNGSGPQSSKLSSSICILGMVGTAPEALLNILIHQLLAILRQQDSPRGTAAAAMVLHAAVDCNPATVPLLQPHLSNLLDVQHCVCGRDQDYILQVLSAVAATEEGLQHLTQCDLAYLVETMLQDLSQDCIAAGLAADIIASMLAQCEAGRAALLPHVAVLAKVCEQKINTRSAAVAACAIHTLKWIADCNGTEGQKAVCSHAGSILSALACMTLPRKAAFWEVGAIQAADGTEQRTIVDLAVEDAAALVHEACKDRVGAAYLASKPMLVYFLQHALTNLSFIEAEQPLLDLSFVLLALAAIPAGWLALVSNNSIDAMLKVAYTSNSTAAQHVLAAMSKMLHIAALGTAEVAAQAFEVQRQADHPPASARKQLQMAVAAKLANSLTREHTAQMLCLLSQPQLAYLGYCCVHQLLQIDCGRIILQPYVEALTERVYAQLPVFAVTNPLVLVAKTAQATAVPFDTFEFIKNLQLLAECSQTVGTDCLKQLKDANDLMQQAIIGFAEAYVAAYHAGGGTATRIRQDKPLMVLLVVVHKAVAERDSTAELAETIQPQALPGPSAQRIAELSLHDWLN